MDPTSLTILGLSAGSGASAGKVLLEKLLGPTLETIGQAIVPAPLVAWKQTRARHAQELLEGASEKLKDANLEPIPVPGRTLWPLLEKGSLEEDNDLRARWVQLLAAAASPQHSSKVHPAFVQILAELTPAEARWMASLYEHTGNNKNKARRRLHAGEHVYIDDLGKVEQANLERLQIVVTRQEPAELKVQDLTEALERHTKSMRPSPFQSIKLDSPFRRSHHELTSLGAQFITACVAGIQDQNTDVAD